MHTPNTATIISVIQIHPSSASSNCFEMHNILRVSHSSVPAYVRKTILLQFLMLERKINYFKSISKTKELNNQ